MKQNFRFKRVKVNLKAIFVGLLVLAISGTIYAQKKIWTLEDCINYALDNNIQIKKSELSASSNESILLQRKLNVLPNLNAYSGYNFNWGSTIDPVTNNYIDTESQSANFGFGTSVTLFNGFRQLNNIRQAQFDYLASKYDSDKMRDDVALQLAAAYLNVLFSQELVERNKSQLRVTEQQTKNTEKLVEAGTVARGNLLEIQAQGASEEVQLVNAENQLNIAYLDLMQLLELNADIEFEIERPNISINGTPEILASRHVYNKALGHLPQIKSAEYRLKSMERQLAMAKGNRLPTLSANYNYGSRWTNTFYKEGNPDNGLTSFNDQIKLFGGTTLGFSLNIPIFNGYQVGDFVKRSRIAVESSNYDLELTKNQVRKSIEQSYSDAIAAYKTYNASIKSVASYKEAFKYMEQKFNVGLENSLNYNMAKMQMTRAESQLIASKYDYIFKTKILDFYMGNPIVLDKE